MRVLVNMLPAAGRKTGIGHYAEQLLRCLREQVGEDRIDAFPGLLPRSAVRLARSVWTSAGPWLERKPDDRPSPSPSSSPHAPASLPGRVARWAKRCGQAALARHLRACARRCDLYHELNFIPLASDLPTVATVHDLSVLLRPEWHPAERARWFERHFARGLARCAHFLTISEHGRQEVIHRLNVAPERVSRTYVGTRPGLRPLPREEVAPVLRRLGLPSQYLLYLGTIEPRKNVLRLLRAYCALPGPLRARWPLVLVGGWGWRTAEVADYLHGEARHRGAIHLGYVADEHLAALYNGARALVFPSHYEGFGLPPVEMLACGGAVLASTAGAVAETVGGCAHLVSPEDVDGWRDAMARVAQDDDWWHQLRRGAVERARPYTWDACAADTLRVYRLLGAAGASRAG